MQLITGLVSNNAAKVRIVLAEKGIDYEAVEVPWSKQNAWEPKPKRLLDNNPRAQVPVLIDADVTLWDSTVINEYLEEKFAEPALFPSGLSNRALCRLWEDEGDHNQSHVGVMIAEVFLAEPGTPLSAAASAALEALDQFYERISQQLHDQEYLCGSFSLADISVFLTVAFATTLGAEIRQPNVQAWFARVLAREQVKREFDAMMAGVAAL